jgi:DNA (cytosine-5)-methyltransferase 1
MPRLLDLFCGAGGCAVGYHRAGFDEIVGVDIKPQPRYPFEFVQAEALEYVREYGENFDAIHASPPCQAHSSMRFLGKGAGDVLAVYASADADSQHSH